MYFDVIFQIYFRNVIQDEIYMTFKNQSLVLLRSSVLVNIRGNRAYTLEKRGNLMKRILRRKDCSDQTLKYSILILSFCCFKRNGQISQIKTFNSNL